MSLVDLVCEIKEDITIDKLNLILKNASQNILKGILGYSEIPLVSMTINKVLSLL